MKIKCSFLLFCLCLSLLFINGSLSRMANASENVETDTAYVLAYYGIATDTETLLTAQETKTRFGINDDPNTKEILSQPQNPTTQVQEKKLSKKEKKQVAKKYVEDFDLDVQLLLNSTNEQMSYSTETRSRVTNTNEAPYYSTAKIYSGSSWIGTGFAVGYNGSQSTYTYKANNSIGYPQDLSSGEYMYQCSGTITSCSSYDFGSNLRVYNGQSGSPVYQQTSGGAYAIAIMTNSYYPLDGTNRALARRIDSSLVGCLVNNGYA